MANRWLLVELLMAKWRRIPFTCSYIPAKEFVPHVVVKAVAAYVIFTVLTSGVLRLSLAHPRTVPVIILVLGIPAGLLCRRRVRQARLVSLTFEDELPTDVTVLGLNAD